MTATHITSLRYAAKSLWKRAPLWRFSLMSGLLLALLFILFPPATFEPKNPPAPSPAAPASYVSASPASPATPAAQNTPPPASPPAQTADLSLATPDSAENDAIRNETGLDPAMLGTLYDDSLKMNGFDIPLPGKHWIMFAHIRMDGPKVSGMSYFLGRVVHKRFVEGVIVQAHRPKPGQEASPFLSSNVAKFVGLYKSTECTALDTNACWLIYGLFTDKWKQWGNRNVKMDILQRAAAGDMAAKGISYPQNLLVVQFMQASKKGYLETLYVFNPETDHIKTPEAASNMDTDWALNNISRYPEKLAYLDKLKKWGMSFWPQIRKLYAAGVASAQP